MAEIIKLTGANIDIDLVENPNITWKQDKCPWNESENTDEHKCAVKNVSLCDYFRGIDYPDKVICIYPNAKLNKGQI